MPIKDLLEALQGTGHCAILRMVIHTRKFCLNVSSLRAAVSRAKTHSKGGAMIYTCGLLYDACAHVLIKKAGLMQTPSANHGNRNTQFEIPATGAMGGRGALAAEKKRKEAKTVDDKKRKADGAESKAADEAEAATEEKREAGKVAARTTSHGQTAEWDEGWLSRLGLSWEQWQEVQRACTLDGTCQSNHSWGGADLDFNIHPQVIWDVLVSLGATPTVELQV